MMRLFLLVCMVFCCINVSASVILRDCQVKTNSEPDGLLSRFDFYIMCGASGYPVEGYSSIQTHGGVSYRELSRLYEDGSVREIGVSVEHPHFEPLSSNNFGGYLTIVSAKGSEETLSIYKNKIKPLVECLSDESYIKQMRRGYGFFKRLFDKQSREFWSIDSLGDSRVYDQISRLTLESDSTLEIILDPGGSSAWRMVFDLSKATVNLESVNQVIK